MSQQEALRAVAPEVLDILFRSARTLKSWLPTPIEPEIFRTLYDLIKLGPTSLNSSPGRFVFVTSPAAKARLEPLVTGNNKQQVREAPCTVIIAWDQRFPEHLATLVPGRDAAAYFGSKEGLVEETGRRNAVLQAGYLILAARALGLDVGPMSGFSQRGVDAEFFPEGRWRSELLCNLGYGDASQLHTRWPRLEWSEACLEI